MNVALLANFSTQFLDEKLAARHRVFSPPGFSVWMSQSLAPSPEFVAFAPEAVVLAVDATMGGELDVGPALAALAEHFPAARVVVPDIAALAADFGEGFYDERMRSLAAMPYSLAGLEALAGEVELSLSSGQGVRKALALDLDGTLWDGVVGEDGVAGIRPRREFQLALKRLAERGVILTALSKNNAADVEPVWSDSRMELRRGDFAAVKIDWNPKSGNLAALARELNLSPEAFVFIDDRAVERERMRAALPEVATPEWNADTLRALAGSLARCCFPAGVTEEDRRRGEMYRARARRGEFAAGLTKEEYLVRLNTEFDIHPARMEEAERIAQLSARTHQFNVSGNVYGADEVRSMIADEGRILLAAYLRDRFGDEGLIGFVHYAGGAIVDFSLSCRAMDRTVEFAMEAELERMLLARGIGVLSARYTRMAKNAPVSDLFSSFGFETVRQEPGRTEYRLHLAGRKPLEWAGCLKGERI